MFLAVSPLLANDEYLELDEDQFVGRVMKNAGGSLNPAEVSRLFHELRKEAGIDAKRTVADSC